MNLDEETDKMIRGFVSNYNAPRSYRNGWKSQMQSISPWLQQYQSSPEEKIARAIGAWANKCSRRASTRNMFSISETRIPEIKKYVLERLLGEVA